MKNNKFFTPAMKMADIIDDNYNLIEVLNRFDVKLGFGEKTVKQVCDIQNADCDLLLIVCNVYSFENFKPQIDKINLNVENLINYLFKSHRYYLSDKITAIENRLSYIEQNCDNNHKVILQKFFDEYKNEVINHFKYEENEVFPYIENLVKGVKYEQYHIDRFEQNHSNIEDKLGDLKNILIKYLPISPNEEVKKRGELLFELFSFEEELNNHKMIEERVLIPYVERLENLSK